MSSLNNEVPVPWESGGKAGRGWSPWLWVLTASQGPGSWGGPECPCHCGCETRHISREWDRRGREAVAEFKITTLTLCPLKFDALDLHYDSGGKMEHLLSWGPLQGTSFCYDIASFCHEEKLFLHLKTRQPPLSASAPTQPQCYLMS